MAKKNRAKKFQLDLFGNGGGSVIVVEKPELRQYQAEGIDTMRKLVLEGFRRIVLVLPTGGGKTVVASSIIDMALAMGKRIIFVAHRIELINQTAKQLARFGITDIGVIRADDKRINPDAPVQVCSIETLRNRDKPPADIVFVDECHRALADSYRALFVAYPDALHIGLTATPFRTDNQGLGELYERLVVCAKPSQLIADGFIESPRVITTPLLPDLTDVEVSGMSHDFHNAQLASAMMKPKLMGNIIEEWKNRAEGRRTVVFAVNIEHSKLICEAFRQEGVRAEHIDANTPTEDRNLALIKLEKYEIQVICNVDVLSEGWDQPSVKCSMLLRPTQSLRLHLQQCGRILRPWKGEDGFFPGPRSALIIDHAGNCRRHGLPQHDRVYDLTKGSISRELGPSLRTCEKCYTLWSGASRECPECGWVMPVKEHSPIQHDETVKLVEIDPTQVFTLEDEQRAYFMKQLALAREQGKKVGWVQYRWKDKYGKWPPYSWKTHAERMYNTDIEWQKAVNMRTQVREHWQGQMQQKRDEIESPSGGPDLGYTEEPEEKRWWGSNETVIPDDDIPF